MSNLKGQNLIEYINNNNLKTVPNFKVGDVVKIFVKIDDANRQRTQFFEGLVIKRQGKHIAETFTLRQVGVERIFPLHSPLNDKIEVIRCGVVRRAKLYYIRKLSSKAARIKEKK